MRSKNGNILWLCIAVITAVLCVSGCKKRNELPSEWQGRYRRTSAFGLVADQYVVVGAKQLEVQNCQFNCGESTLALSDVHCTGAGLSTECAYTSSHCRGTVSVDSRGRISITADALPSSATGEALRVHNETCNNIRANMMERAN